MVNSPESFSMKTPELLLTQSKDLTNMLLAKEKDLQINGIKQLIFPSLENQLKLLTIQRTENKLMSLATNLVMLSSLFSMLLVVGLNLPPSKILRLGISCLD